MHAEPEAQRADVTTAVEQLAWTQVREALHLEPETGAPGDLSDPELRQMWLAALTTLLAIRDTADMLAASAALSAAQHGADYPAIGDAAGMTRQGARRKWPGLAGLSDERRGKLAWWNQHGHQFLTCVRAVLAPGGQPDPLRLDLLRERLEDIEQASPAERMEAFDMLLIDAHVVAAVTPSHADPAAAHARGLLAAFTADAYAATNSHAALVTRDHLTCAAHGCTTTPILELWRPDLDDQTTLVCREHAVQTLRQPAIRIASAYRPDVALTVFDEANGEA